MGNGFSPQGREAFLTRKQAALFLVDGLRPGSGGEGLGKPDLLRLKLRKLTEEGAVFVSVREFLSVSGG